MQRWPFFDLRVRTPKLELRMPTDDDLCELFELARKGIHDPEVMPFLIPWTDHLDEPDALHRFCQYHWQGRGAIAPERFSLELAVVVDGAIVGTQSIRAVDFALVRVVITGSWVGRAHQGKGIGSEMRATILQLAFAGLDARCATTEAFDDNPASLRVTEKLGYVENGQEWLRARDAVVLSRNYRMEREDWEPRRRTDIEISGLEACLPLLGL